MKFLHTSDWHFGRTLHGSDLTAAFEMWADHVVDLAVSHDLDAVLVSGDVFDRGIPPVAMVKLLSTTLERLAGHTAVVLISGNHDAPTRLGFTSGLLRSGISIVSDPRECGMPIEIMRDGELVGLVYALPYLDPDVDRVRLAEDPDKPLERSHEAVVGAALDLVRRDITDRGTRVPHVIMAHEFVVGGEPSDSERDIHVGGVDSVPSGLFDLQGDSGSLIDYVALGHLHRPQKVCDRPLMRYAGSPIAFSFSEEHHHKSSVLVTIDEPGAIPAVEIIPAPVFRPLVTLEGTMDELLSSTYAAYHNHFVRIIVTDVDRPERMLARLRVQFPHTLEARHNAPFTQVEAHETSISKVNPVDILAEFFASSGGRELTPEEHDLITKEWDSFMMERKEDAL